MALVGSSGSGKTLTVLSLLGLQPKTCAADGSALFCAPNLGPVDLIRLNERQRNRLRGRHLAMIFQEPLSALNPVFTCGYQIQEVVRQHCRLRGKAAQQRTLQLLEQVRFEDPRTVYHSYPHQLSGGQRQRVMLAMALAASPSLLIADEPTTALDAIAQAELLQLIGTLSRQFGMSLLFITHDLGVAANLAEHIVVMDQGVTVESGPTTSVMSSPVHEATRRLLHCLHRRGIFTVSNEPNKHFSKSANVSSADDVLAAATAPNRPVVLQVRHLYVHYQNSFAASRNRRNPAVKNVSFDVYEGESVGLTGISGSGKSSVARAIVRLLDDVAGQVQIHHENQALSQPLTSGKPPPGVQLIFQDPFASLNPRLSTRTILTEAILAAQPHLAPKEQSAFLSQLLDWVRLDASVLDRFPHQFSAGQRQRLAIARALATKPRLLICDECFASLDVCAQAAIMDLLQQLRRELHLALLIISHDLVIIRQLCQRLLLLHQGQLIEQNTTERWFDQPVSDIGKKLLSSARQWNRLPDF